MKNLDTTQAEHPEEISSNELLKLSKKTVLDLYQVMRVHGWDLYPHIFAQGQLPRCLQAEDALIETSLGDTITMKVRRSEKDNNKITEIEIRLLPIDERKINLFEGIEEELASERMVRNKKEMAREEKQQAKKELMSHGATGTEMATCRILFKRDKTSLNSNNTGAVSNKLALKFGNNMEAKFDPITNSAENIEEPYAQIVHHRFFKELSDIIKTETALASNLNLRAALNQPQTVEGLLNKIRQQLAEDPDRILN